MGSICALLHCGGACEHATHVRHTHQSDLWTTPIFRETGQVCLSAVRSCIARCYKCLLRSVTDQLMDTKFAEATFHALRVLRYEKNPFTQNGADLIALKGQYLVMYKTAFAGHRSAPASTAAFTPNTDFTLPHAPPLSMHECTSTAKRLLDRHRETDSDIQPDEHETEIEVMAEVSAYFKLASSVRHPSIICTWVETHADRVAYSASLTRSHSLSTTNSSAPSLRT